MNANTTTLLEKGDVVKSLNSIRFSENNQYRFFMDFYYFKGIPSNIDFYPVYESKNRTIEFIGDGYGVQKKHGVPGNYGNGSICVYIDDIPHLIDWCRQNFLPNSEK